MNKIFTILAFSILIFMFGKTNAQVYNACKAQNEVYVDVVDDATGEVSRTLAKQDQYGNAAGNQYDLAVDGAFEGETIVVLQFYTGEGFDFSLPQAALKEKGFSVYRWMNQPPPAEELKEALDKACELWIISSNYQTLNAQHIEVIKEFFDAGHGVYIWGDNDPYYADANYVADALFGGQMLGNYMGNQVVGLKEAKTNSGLVPQHLITTGLQYVYEGITIASIQSNQYLKPLIYNSEGNIVAAYYDNDGKRAILDGGFTRLYISWDAAGTGRYVKNAAAWLVNYERFGENKSREPKKDK
ncbi:MAG: hypothetical protein JXL97_05375 [Bacteroidales bacterium]|nr:hypothetical protein [Bacteroidales bacterium]